MGDQPPVGFFSSGLKKLHRDFLGDFGPWELLEGEEEVHRIRRCITA